MSLAHPDDSAGIGEVLVEVVRGDLVEAIHRGVIAVVAADGRLLASVGDPHRKVAYWRSSAKPFQSMPLVYLGVAERFGLDAADLAICTSSHNGEPDHVTRVASVLAKLGLPPDRLVCGTHAPLHGGAADDLRRDGRPPHVLHNNCSGLHAGMLATALHTGSDLAGYADGAHAVQQEILENIVRFTGLERAEIIVGVDDCASPCHGLSIYHMALAYARLMTPVGFVEDRYAAAAGTIREAMMANPWLIAGSGRLDSDIIAAGAGSLVAKGGASGVECVGVAGGIGIALKLEDGATGPAATGQPTTVALLEALRQHGVLDPSEHERLREHAVPVLTTRAGAVVGSARPAFMLDRHTP
ncbi:asparaginase [soil metagenome]